MTIYRSILLLLNIFILPVVSFAQNSNTVTDYLNIPGPLTFKSKAYNLVRTNFIPDSAAYNTYKQEYLASGDTLSIYKSLILITVFKGNANIEDIANAKVAELGELKAANPIVDYKTFSNKKTGELMIDFITSENTSDGQYIDIVERNVYRYNTVTDKSGQECVLLFALSTRAYGDDVEKFLAELKSKQRIDLTREIGKFVLPEVTISK